MHYLKVIPYVLPWAEGFLAFVIASSICAALSLLPPPPPDAPELPVSLQVLGVIYVAFGLLALRYSWACFPCREYSLGQSYWLDVRRFAMLLIMVEMGTMYAQLPYERPTPEEFLRRLCVSSVVVVTMSIVLPYRTRLLQQQMC